MPFVKKKNKKFFHALLLLCAFLILLPSAILAEYKTPLSVFVREGCGHCSHEEEFITELQNKRSDFEVFYYDINTETGREKFLEITKLENLQQGTPIALVGNTIVQGFGTAETTGKEIEELLDLSCGKQTLNFEEYLSKGGSKGGVKPIESENQEECDANSNKFLVDVPFYGVVNLKSFSLPMIATILGFVDGFNPCAMWVLITFLLVLMQIGDKKRMWQIAGLFIAAETIMYFLILNLWFTTWNFIGLDRIVTPIIGIVAIGGGIFFLWEAKKNDGTCHVTNPEQRKKTHNKIKDLAARPMTIATAIGVIGLALSVNIIEFACSIGIPQAFTKILEINRLSWGANQGLILLYTLFYMIDDIIVFGLALWSFEHLHLTQKYARWCNIIGGILMIILGLLLIFNPAMLRF
ncbi:MAG: glutaredoxin [bacterium]